MSTIIWLQYGRIFRGKKFAFFVLIGMNFQFHLVNLLTQTNLKRNLYCRLWGRIFEHFEYDKSIRNMQINVINELWSIQNMFSHNSFFKWTKRNIKGTCFSFHISRCCAIDNVFLNTIFSAILNPYLMYRYL